jgi:hypothetical protein
VNLFDKKNDKIVSDELTRAWLRKGERLRFGVMPVRAHVRANVGGELRLPHEPLHEVPALDREKLGQLPRLPSPEVAEEDWPDDPAVGHFAWARTADQLAVHYADHFAHSHGEARLAVSDRRVAVVYPSKFLGDPSTLFTTYCETDLRQVRFSAPFAGRSVPPPRVLRADFADGSVLLLRDPLALVHLERLTG